MADQELRIRLTAVTAGFSRGIDNAQSKLNAFGAKAKQIGSSLKSIQIPLALAGGAAVKLAVDFDKSMTQIESLVGIAGNEVKKMGEEAKMMASATGQSASEAAEALFFITSAGLRGEEAMQVLNASLQSAAIGLGEAKTVADLATSAMNAYGSEVLSASGATDVLGAAVREGKLEASTLAGAMGSVLPVASNMGVQFHEVGAAFAAMSRTGTNAAEASTQLNSIMMAIMKPSEDAKKALDELGLSSEGLRQQIKEKGLLDVFMTLKDASLQNSAAFERVFGNVRALKGIMDLTGAGFESTRQIFDNMANTAGFTADAFAKVEQSASFKLQKALNSVKVSFTELGATILGAILPYIEKLSNFVVNLFNAFKNLNPMVKGLVLAAGGLALVLPTVLSLLGTIAGAIGALLSPIGLVIAALGGIVYIIVQNWGTVKKAIVEVTNYFIDLYNESLGFRIIIQTIGGIFIGLFEVGKRVFKGLWEIIKSVAENIMIAFKSAGKVIKGVFTLDPDMIAEGFQEGTESLVNTVVDVIKEADATLMDAAGLMVVSIADGVERAKKSTPIELMTEGDIDNFVNNIKDKVVEAGKKISGLFQSGFAQNQNDGAKKVNEKPFELKGFSDVTDKVQNIGIQTLSIIGNSFDSVTQRFERLKEFVSSNAELIGRSLQSAFETMLTSENPIKALGQMIVGLMKRLIAAAAAAAILSAILGGIGVGGFGFKAGNTSFKNIFGAMSGVAFANGGIVSSPTLGLVGEYAGARSNPEVIAPLDRLKSIIGDRSGGNVNVTGQFRLDGQDLVVAVERANNERSNLIG
jgi:TP901 family phage tail tape measure protein